MHLDARLRRIFQVSLLECLAALLWVVMVFVVTGAVLVHPKRHTVFPIMADAGESWIVGESLYDNEWWRKGLDAFRYSPAAAVLLAPLGALPLWLGGVLWRLTNVGVLLGDSGGGFERSFRALTPSNQRAILLLVMFPMMRSISGTARAIP